MNSNNWITIKTYWQVHEAEMTRNLLNAHDIDCQIKDNFTLQSDPLLNNTIGGAKIQVRPNQLNEAIELLTSKGILTDKDNVDSSFYNKIERFLRKYLNL